MYNAGDHCCRCVNTNPICPQGYFWDTSLCKCCDSSYQCVESGTPGSSEEFCPDADYDGYTDVACGGEDCDDDNSMAYPGAPLGSCGTGFSMGWRDWNCNGQDDYVELGCSSPVLIDVAGDGFRLTDAISGVGFNIDGRGAPERLSWTVAGTDDAWLSLDRDGNGRIDSGLELFGNYTPQPVPPPGTERNGFLALAEYDRPAQGGNGDGMIDRRDIIYASLRLWRDTNHNGVSEPSELHTLPALDVMRLHLDYKESKRTDEHGNRFRYRAKVDDAKGAKAGRWAWDVFLVTAR